MASGFAGDGGLGTAAELCEPMGVAVDDTGGVSTTTCGKIRHVPASGGPIRVDAGANLSGISPDGAPAGSSVFNGAAGLCYDANNKLLIADANNHCIRGQHIPAVSVISDLENKSPVIIHLFPNPVSRIFRVTCNIQNGEENSDLKLTVTNMLGQVIIREKMNISGAFAETLIDLDDSVPEGIYFCNVAGSCIRQTIPFTVQH